MHLSITTTPAGLMHLRAINSEALKRKITSRTRRIVKEEGRVQRAKLDRLVRPWITGVDFKVEFEENSDKISVTVSTDNKIFYFVDQGTKVRYATMTSDFIPATYPGSLHSGPVFGDVAYINKKRPRPGIESRRFMETLYNERRPIFSKKIADMNQQLISNFFKNLFGG